MQDQFLGEYFRSVNKEGKVSISGYGFLHMELLQKVTFRITKSLKVTVHTTGGNYCSSWYKPPLGQNI
jgi:hypothetical protein